VSSPSSLKLVVVRGQQNGAEYPLKEGANVLGRAAAGDQPVDVELDQQERPGQVWAANQHAIITVANGGLTVEDTGTAYGTYVNRVKIQPNTPQPLQPNDVVQVGTVQLKVTG
jgi:pSer/pThr/pTyr-binding forkhead associated (FHA) protein